MLARFGQLGTAFYYFGPFPFWGCLTTAQSWNLSCLLHLESVSSVFIVGQGAHARPLAFNAVASVRS